MTQLIFVPPVAFLVYFLLVSLLSGIGKLMAGTGHPTSTFKSSVYASGEAPQLSSRAPGYRPFFLIAFFFAVLHLGVLVLATSMLAPVAGVYLIGLILALSALILG